MTDLKSSLSVGVLVLNYNTWDLAVRAVSEAIRLEGDGILEYVLFDDGSPTPPPAQMDPRVRLICGGVNRGYTSALKLALAKMKSDLIVVFDADAYPLAPFASTVRQAFENDTRAGELAFFAEDEKGSPTQTFVWSEPTKWTLLLGQKLHTWLSPKVLQASHLCVFSCCMATRREAYLQVGGIDDNFDFLDADLDYSMRLRRNGWKVAADPRLKAFHAGGAWRQLQRHRVLRFYKSRWYLLRKYNLITNVGMARTFILARLRLEQLFLELFGLFMFRSPEILSEKRLGRRELIAYCRDHYR